MEAGQASTHLNWAAWTSLNTGTVSFSRDWDGAAKPEMWWGDDRLPLKLVRQVPPEHFGLQGGYYGSGDSIVFVVPAALTRTADLSQGLYVAGSFNGWEAAVGDPDWEMQPGSVRRHACHVLEVPRGRFDHQEHATFKFVTGGRQWLEVPPQTRNTHIDGYGIRNYLFSTERTGRHLFRFTTPLPLNRSEGRKLHVRIGGVVEAVRLSPGVFLKTIEAPGPLGAVVQDGHTLFRLFAPRARAVRLHLYRKHDQPASEAVPLELGQDLVWETRLPGNRHGWFYHYTVEGQEAEESGHFDQEFPVVDPYAKALCGPRGPGIVVDDAFFGAPEPFRPARWHDLVIAEAHVRDLTAAAPVEMTDDERLGFRGLERWAADPQFYIAQLGVNAVELQPVHEFDTLDKAAYAWGYMPVNFFAPASQYCADPCGLSQVTEFRGLVRTLHRRGLAVILDVVYNHVGDPNYLQYLDKEYYFLLDADGNYLNHTGCGNTLDASAPMVRRLIRDSLVHWIRAYGVDGFRFDLAEILGREALEWLEQELKRVNPEIVLIAEPWSFRGHIARELRQTGFASWNDGYREFVKDYVTLAAPAADLRHFMQGSHPEWSRFPAQTVNYIESHDDRCWIDKITENPGHDGTRPTAADRRRTHLAAAILLMSVGIPMLSSGMDMLKSKGGVNNTYLRGDLNAIPYSRLAEYSGTAEYFRRWIAFRLGRHGRLLRLDGFPGRGFFHSTHDSRAFGMIWNADRSLGRERLLFVVNPAFEPAELRFAGEDLRAFRQVADTERFGDPQLDPPLAPPHFWAHGSRMAVPPLACGLFIEHG